MVLSRKRSHKKRHSSVISVKSVVDQVHSSKVCPWVAQWFTIPQIVVKVLQFMLSVPAVVLMLVWRSEGITIADLNTDIIDYRNILFIYTGIGILSAVYSVCMISIGLIGVRIPPAMQTALASMVLVSWLLGAPVMSASIEQLENTLYIRSRGVDMNYLISATLLGFGSLLICLIDILLGFQSIRGIDQDSKEFASELIKSKSVISSMRSSQSIYNTRNTSSSVSKPISKTAPVKVILSTHSGQSIHDSRKSSTLTDRSSSSSINKLINEISPLQMDEIIQRSRDDL